MATFLTTFLFLMMAIRSYSMAEVLRIERSSNWHQDDIRVPDSQCPGNQANCDVVKGVKHGACWCSCGDIQSEHSGFYEANSTCVRVSQVRQQAGCQHLFEGESAYQRLAFFPSTSVREKDISVPDNQRCTFHYGHNNFHVHYLDCTGSWRSISQQSVLDTIEFGNWSTSHLKIGIKAGTSIFQNATAGRLVRVAIQCRTDTPSVSYTSSCVVFQVHGTIRCPYPQPTRSPALTQATLPTPVTDNLNATGTLPPVITREKKPTTTPSSEKTTKSEVKASSNERSLSKPTKSQPRVQF